jgi:hypothetical protein
MSGRPFPIIPVFVALGMALWLSWPNLARSAEQRILCPTTLEPGTVQGKAPPGWRFAMPQAANLTAAGMLHGPPKESAYLAPAESKSSNPGTRSSWTQRWRLERPHWYPTFVYCGYGGDPGPLQLFYPIPEDATECMLTSSRKGGALERASFACR